MWSLFLQSLRNHGIEHMQSNCDGKNWGYCRANCDCIICCNNMNCDGMCWNSCGNLVLEPCHLLCFIFWAGFELFKHTVDMIHIMTLLKEAAKWCDFHWKCLVSAYFCWCCNGTEKKICSIVSLFPGKAIMQQSKQSLRYIINCTQWHIKSWTDMSVGFFTMQN